MLQWSETRHRASRVLRNERRHLGIAMGESTERERARDERCVRVCDHGVCRSCSPRHSSPLMCTAALFPVSCGRPPPLAFTCYPYSHLSLTLLLTCRGVYQITTVFGTQKRKLHTREEEKQKTAYTHATASPSPPHLSSPASAGVDTVETGAVSFLLGVLYRRLHTAKRFSFRPSSPSWTRRGSRRDLRPHHTLSHVPSHSARVRCVWRGIASSSAPPLLRHRGCICGPFPSNSCCAFIWRVDSFCCWRVL